MSIRTFVINMKQDKTKWDKMVESGVSVVYLTSNNNKSENASFNWISRM